MTNCRNCNTPIDGNFCGNCGQPRVLKRVDSHYVVHEITHILHFEKGIFYTIKELVLRPGKNIREFITDDRGRLVKPILFIIVTSFIYSLINNFFHIEQGYIELSGMENTATAKIFQWMEHYYGYTNIITGVFIAFWLKLFFKKYDYNFFELLILLCFVIGIGMLIFAVFALIEGLTHTKLMGISGIIAFAYLTWAIGQFYDGKKASSYIKALTAYLLGMIMFSASALILGFLIDAL
jgi:hypothetical protein